MQFVFLGDIMFGWKIRENILNQGIDHPFRNMPLPLSENAVMIANLETVVSDRTLHGIPLKNDRIVSPSACLNSLKKAGISCVSLANNHVYDYGREGLSDTLQHLASNDIRYFGAGMNRAEAFRAITLQAGAVRVGLISRTFTCEAANRNMADHEPQAAELIRNDLLKKVQEERPEYGFLIIVLHTGYEYCFYPDHKDVIYFRQLIDAGADLVIGHHPHVYQGIEKYNKGLIAYSLGNFLFDTTGEDIPETTMGFMLAVSTKEQDGMLTFSDYSITPTVIGASGQIELAQLKTRDQIIEHVSALSRPLELDIGSYKKFSDDKNAGIMLSVRKKEIISKLRNLEWQYLLKKASNIRWVHIRLALISITRKIIRRTQ